MEFRRIKALDLVMCPSRQPWNSSDKPELKNQVGIAQYNILGSEISSKDPMDSLDIVKETFQVLRLGFYAYYAIR